MYVDHVAPFFLSFFTKIYLVQNCPFWFANCILNIVSTLWDWLAFAKITVTEKHCTYLNEKISYTFQKEIYIIALQSTVFGHTAMSSLHITLLKYSQLDAFDVTTLSGQHKSKYNNLNLFILTVILIICCVSVTSNIDNLIQYFIAQWCVIFIIMYSLF